METCYTFVNHRIDILKKRCLLMINCRHEVGDVRSASGHGEGKLPVTIPLMSLKNIVDCGYQEIYVTY